MSQEMRLSFAGARGVTAHYDGFQIATDQPVDDGGEGTAPAPFDLFLAALVTCAGYYALRFCQQRDLDTTGLEVVQSWRRDEHSRRIEEIRIQIRPPRGFPEKYRRALVRAAEQCSVKKALADPPAILTDLVDD